MTDFSIQGLIRRRILVNFRVAPDVIQRILPAPFRPKLLGDAAVAGICLIRLEQIRPRILPSSLGLTSENAAHRIAVCWTGADGREQEGVYIPRRDSNSRLNQLLGGRLFPGEHEPAAFDVRDDGASIDFRMRSRDGAVRVDFRARPRTDLPATSRFASLDEASAFFQAGSLGYSATSDGRRLEGLTLVTHQWRVDPLEVTDVSSSFFSDPTRFPPGSVDFDCALVMRDVQHSWHPARGRCP
jgi:hypothetical protein